jgi:hypothetical protein
VTNAGETHDHVSKPQSGDHLEFHYTGTQEGKPAKEVITFDFSKDGKTIATRSETSVAGATVATMDFKLTRK